LLARGLESFRPTVEPLRVTGMLSAVRQGHDAASRAAAGATVVKSIARPESDLLAQGVPVKLARRVRALIDARMFAFANSISILGG
jgi:hypothetical protein